MIGKASRARADTAASHSFAAEAALASALVAGLAITTLLFVLRPLSLEMPAPGLDGSWVTVLGEAAARHARWGVDLAFTYGPASALMTRYYTDGYLTSVVPLVVATAFAYGWCLERLLSTAACGWRLTLAFGLTMMVATPALHLDPDPFYFDLAVLVFLLDLVRVRTSPASALAAVLGALALGVAAMAKTSIGVVSASLFVLADIHAALVLRRLPLLTLAFLTTTAATYLAYGQRFADLPEFMRLQWEVAAGYGEAMLRVHAYLEIFGFLTVTGLLMGYLGWWTWAVPGRRVRHIVATIGVTVVFCVGFKAGFVRQDTHPQISWLLLGMVGIATSTALILPLSIPQAASVSAASVALLWLAAPALLLKEMDAPINAVNLATTYANVWDAVTLEQNSWERLAFAPAAFAAAAMADKDAAWADIKTDHPLPRLEGTLDMIPSEQSSVLANGLHYRPRPSFQEYSTYTTALIAANVGFYKGPSAPDWVLFGSRSIDDRYPNMTEGALWPVLLQLYQPVMSVGSYWAWSRRTAPLGELLGPTRYVKVEMGEKAGLPIGAATFARITVRKTLLGRLASMLFRPTGLTMHISLANGHGQDYRFIPSIAAGGFLLSPRIDNAEQFSMLGVGRSDAATGDRVTDVSIVGGEFAGLFYEPDIKIEFQPLVVDAAAR